MPKKAYLLLSSGLLLLILLTLVIFGFSVLKNKNSSWSVVSPLSKQSSLNKEKELEKYTFENIKKRGGLESEINLEQNIKDNELYSSFLFSYQSDGRKITGLANIAKRKNLLPVVVMIRGYVDQEVYQPGMGTAKAAEVFAQNGFITLAPDFLGYGQSDDPPDDVWQERFLRPIAIIDLIASIASLEKADVNNIFLWGHSNGGLIALSVLEIIGVNYPTTLWAPVSQFFPYDVLYYSYEFDDRGKALRKNLAEFEKDYNTDDYSFTNYLDWISSPIQIHQGENDEYIPLWWTKNLVENLQKNDLSVKYYQYSDANHNMSGNWKTVVERDLLFFNQHLNTAP